MSVWRIYTQPCPNYKEPTVFYWLVPTIVSYMISFLLQAGKQSNLLILGNMLKSMLEKVKKKETTTVNAKWLVHALNV